MTSDPTPVLTGMKHSAHDPANIYFPTPTPATEYTFDFTPSLTLASAPYLLLLPQAWSGRSQSVLPRRS